VKHAIPHLRATKGRVIFTSSGAATKAYTSWGAYGSSKAALNSLSQHIAVEEPDITAVAVSPGRVDTDMQKEIREKGTAMLKKDYEDFKSAFEEGKLVRPEQSGGVIARLSVNAKPELSGKYFKYVSGTSTSYPVTNHCRWDAPELAEYRQ
jgi:NAD(P)-dependent dehydrogenase (short-subunit alcohol dehydrogenase family)